MKISGEIGSAARLLGEEKAIEYMARSGFDAWDFSMDSMCRYDSGTGTLLPTSHPLAGKDYLAFARKLKQVGLDNGIVCNQSHAPTPTYCEPVRSYFKRAIECTAEAGGNICVIHPDNYRSAEENAEMYLELLPFAKDCGVMIAAENMFGFDNTLNRAVPHACGTPESFIAHLDAADDEYLVACLDIGHAQFDGLGTSATEMIYALGDRIKALHIHDNDLCRDLHQIPFSLKIDYAPIVTALKDIGYCGYLTLEAKSYLRQYTAETAPEGILKLAESARRLAVMFPEISR